MGQAAYEGAIAGRGQVEIEVDNICVAIGGSLVEARRQGNEFLPEELHFDYTLSTAGEWNLRCDKVFSALIPLIGQYRMLKSYLGREKSPNTFWQNYFYYPTPDTIHHPAVRKLLRTIREHGLRPSYDFWSDGSKDTFLTIGAELPPPEIRIRL